MRKRVVRQNRNLILTIWSPKNMKPLLNKKKNKNENEQKSGWITIPRHVTLHREKYSVISFTSALWNLTHKIASSHIFWASFSCSSSSRCYDNLERLSLLKIRQSWRGPNKRRQKKKSTKIQNSWKRKNHCLRQSSNVSFCVWLQSRPRKNSFWLSKHLLLSDEPENPYLFDIGVDYLCCE